MWEKEKQRYNIFLRMISVEPQLRIKDDASVHVWAVGSSISLKYYIFNT